MTHRFIWLAPISIMSAAVVCTPSTGYAVQYLTIQQAQAQCFSEATSFIDISVNLTKEQSSIIEKKSGVKVRLSNQKVWAAYSKTTFLGWFILDDVIGKHDFINWALALNPDGSVKQVEILQYRESYGSEIRNEKWRSQFVGKTKTAPLKLNKDIKNISGATLSSRHVTDGVKRLLAFHESVLLKLDK